MDRGKETQLGATDHAISEGKGEQLSAIDKEKIV
jgi:hypothetical protein